MRARCLDARAAADHGAPCRRCGGHPDTTTSISTTRFPSRRARYSRCGRRSALSPGRPTSSISTSTSWIAPAYGEREVGLALFDFDGTLTTRDTIRPLGAFLVEHAHARSRTKM